MLRIFNNFDAGPGARFAANVGMWPLPSIEEDMQMVAAHCGSLLLDAASITQVHLLAARNEK
jgi:hypothetical protein